MRRGERCGPALLSAALLLASCSEGVRTGSHRQLVVFAASSLTQAFTELGVLFEKDLADTAVRFQFAGSSQLVRDLANGAPADVLATADEETMDRAVEGGDVLAATTAFARNRLAIAVEPRNPKSIRGLSDLARRDVTIVLCAPVVPCGKAAKSALSKAGVAVVPRSYEENVKAVVAKVGLGEADAGIVFATDVLVPGSRVDGVAIADEDNIVTTCLAGAVTGSSQPTMAAEFVAFLGSGAAQAVLARYGFLP